jgi:2-haloacid dehalogenase
MQITLAADARQSLLQAYFTLSAYGEVKTVLTQLRARGLVLGTLSNGSPEMLDAVLRSSGVDQLLDHVMSVDAVKQFKPHKTVYALGPQTLKIPAAEILFVSSNAWDIAGATWFGYRTFWVNRSQAPREILDGKPTAGEAKTLDALLTLGSLIPA